MFPLHFLLGASNIEIRQAGFKHDDHYIVLCDDKGRYILNGPEFIPYRSKFSYGGLEFTYSGISEPLENVTTIFGKKISRDLKALVSIWTTV